MKYIGNFHSWIVKNNILEFLQSIKGDNVPVWQPNRWQGNKTLETVRENVREGYSNNKFFFHQVNKNSKECTDFYFEWPKINYNKKKYFWWFVILYPGEFQPMHIDPHLTEISSFERYTMFLQDWQPGHIFTYDNKMLSDYKSGDMYEWNNPNTLHGPVNIGYKPRYTLQITGYDEELPT